MTLRFFDFPDGARPPFFFEITNFNSRTFQRYVLHQLAKFFGDRLYRRRDDAILAFLMKCKNSLDDYA